jgi:hypothetical protein
MCNPDGRHMNVHILKSDKEDTAMVPPHVIEFEGKLMKAGRGIENDSLTIKASNQSATITLPPGSVNGIDPGVLVEVSITISKTLFDEDENVGEPAKKRRRGRPRKEEKEDGED